MRNANVRNDLKYNCSRMSVFVFFFFFFYSCFIVGLSFCCLFCYHVFYLAFVRFDYGYNMKFNVTIGELG